MVTSTMVAGAALCVLATPVVESEAESESDWIGEDQDDHVRKMRVDFLANAGYFNTIQAGIGIFYSVPIAHDGILPPVNDQLDFEVGTYLQYHQTYFTCLNRWGRLTPLAGLRWVFHLFPEWSVYASVKLGASIPFAAQSSCNSKYTRHVVVDGVGALGTYYQFGNNLAVRVEISNFGVAGGVSLLF